MKNTRLNFLTNGIKENTPQFRNLISEAILNLKLGESAEFKTSKGDFGVSFIKKFNHFSIMLDGHGVNEVPTSAEAVEWILGLYDGHN